MAEESDEMQAEMQSEQAELEELEEQVISSSLDALPNASPNASPDAPLTHKWYVVQVMSAQEKSVKKSLDDNRESRGVKELISEVLLPTENVAEMKQGQQRVTEKRLWPGYLLLKMEITDRSWAYVKDTKGVIGFLGGGDPESLSDQEVREILAELQSKQDKVIQKHQFAIGSLVRITDGVFVNFTGNVIDVFHDKGRLSVMVSIFGRETRVDDLEFWQVEEMTDEEEG